MEFIELEVYVARKRETSNISDMWSFSANTAYMKNFSQAAVYTLSYTNSSFQYYMANNIKAFSLISKKSATTKIKMEKKY